MEQAYLPGKIRDRIRDLMKERKITQETLATKIGMTEISLSRFISGKTDKLGDEYIIRIARVFNVSTDFLLGEVDVPDRLNYDIAELGLSVQAARNLYTKKVDTDVLNRLLENPKFADTTYRISQYLNDELASGFAAQNQMYSTVAELMCKNKPEAAADIRRLKTSVYQADLSSIETMFMNAVKEIKIEYGNDLKAAQKLTELQIKKIYSELAKGQHKPNKKITGEQLAESVAQVICSQTGIDKDAAKVLFMKLAGMIPADEGGKDDK